ncbi:ribokinase [Metabacillus arenae]|uniref:Ribokinase n=1 Tax=Metabacillus arenae TaxID=2771434 RepID=A0A926RY57_9BACI|nr:ribokinase [Metabacillus arenae]MBD1381365.1 ribokinase [Metabacillus arenae]
MSLVIVGSFNMDLMSRTPYLPSGGETVLGGPFKMGPGGKGSNQAVAAARQSAEVILVSMLGRDSFGEKAADMLERENIKTEHVFFHSTESTGTALILVDEQSENMIVVAPGANLCLSPLHVRKAEKDIRAASLVLLQFEINMEATIEAIELADKHNVPVLLNPAPFVEFNPAILEKVTYITPNKTEAEGLTGIKIQGEEDVLQAAKKIYKKGVKYVLITLGSSGTYLYSGKETGELIPSFAVNVTDTTGAGDAFNGGFACAIDLGFSVKEAVVYGQAAAALSVTKEGTSPSMPTKEEVEKFLKERTNG